MHGVVVEEQQALRLRLAPEAERVGHARVAPAGVRSVRAIRSMSGAPGAAGPQIAIAENYGAGRGNSRLLCAQ